MEKRTYKTEGIILARRNIGEADRLLTVFSKHYGKLRVIAKGVRRTTSRKRGALELFSQTTLYLAKGKTFDIITEAEVKNNFNQWRKDLLRVGVAYHLAEIVSKLTREGQEHRKVYDLLIYYYLSLATISFWQLHNFISTFKKAVLTDLGFLGQGRERDNLDSYIEELSQSKLRTKRFLQSLT